MMHEQICPTDPDYASAALCICHFSISKTGERKLHPTYDTGVTLYAFDECRLWWRKPMASGRRSEQGELKKPGVAAAVMLAVAFHSERLKGKLLAEFFSNPVLRSGQDDLRNP